MRMPLMPLSRNMEVQIMLQLIVKGYVTGMCIPYEGRGGGLLYKKNKGVCGNF